MQLTLGALVDHAPLGLYLVSGDDSARSRPIFGVHSIELEHPTRWLPEHWVMLTHGVRLRNRPSEQRRMVRELVEADCVALGFGVGTVFQQVPAAVLAEARARRLPVFRIPYATPCREIIAFAHSSLLNSDLHNARRVLACQDYLMDGMLEPDIERTLVDRLASVLDRGVILTGRDGIPRALSGPAAASGLTIPRLRSSDRVREAISGDLTIAATPIAVDGEVLMTLCVIGARGQGTSPLVHSLLRTAARLLALVARTRHAGAERRRDIEKQILLGILGSDSSETTERELIDLAAAHGIDGAAPMRAVVARCRPGTPTEAARSQLATVTERHRLPTLATELDDEIIIVAQGGESAIGAWAHDISSQGVRVGIGRVLQQVTDAPSSLRDARIALSNTGAAVATVDDLNLAATAVAMTDGGLVRRHAAALLAPLKDSPTLTRTLSSYLDNDQDINRTARQLHLHPNSVRYRLRRIEELLEIRLASASSVADLYLALLSERSDVTASSPGEGPADAPPLRLVVHPAG